MIYSFVFSFSVILFSSLDRHMQTHHGHHKPFRCKLCPFKSSYNSRLKTHILKAHAGKFSLSLLQCSRWNGRCILVPDRRCWFELRVLSPNLGKIFKVKSGLASLCTCGNQWEFGSCFLEGPEFNTVMSTSKTFLFFCSLLYEGLFFLLFLLVSKRI